MFSLENSSKPGSAGCWATSEEGDVGYATLEHPEQQGLCRDPGAR